MRKTALIMAGGRGERFWPKSRVGKPKQFLALTDDKKTMIQLTVERILPLVKMEDIFVATVRDYYTLVREQLPELPAENILCEPVGKNTAPCIGLGAVHMARRHGDAVMFVLPSDHLITNQDIFLDTLADAAALAEDGQNLVTLGIRPESPETGYGYIKIKGGQADCGAYVVERFVEKPDLETAKEYLASGQYLWNSGMFVWKVSTILNNLERHLPEIYRGLCRIREAIGNDEEYAVLQEEFTAFRAESIDYGVMEKAENIYTLTGRFGWDDVGSWLAVARLKKADEMGNVFSGNVVDTGVRNCIVQGEKRVIALVGVEDLVVVDTEDALLVCNKKCTGEIRRVLQQLSAHKRITYL